MHAIGSVFHMGGYLRPFDLALLASVACSVAALLFWEENYGEARASVSDAEKTRESIQSSCGGFGTACTVTIRSREILLCGVVSSFYEASMYVSFSHSSASLTQ